MWNLAKILTDLFFVINGVQMQRKQGVLAMGWEVKLLLRKKKSPNAAYSWTGKPRLRKLVCNAMTCQFGMLMYTLLFPKSLFRIISPG